MTRHSAPFGGRLLQSERIIVTIPQAPDGINLYLQLFNLKLRSCIFCSLSTPIICAFWAFHTIRYFLTDFPRKAPGKFPVFPFFCRPRIGDKCCASSPFAVQNRPSGPGGTVASATVRLGSCILQEDDAFPAFLPFRNRKGSSAAPCSLWFQVFQQEFFQLPGFPCEGFVNFPFLSLQSVWNFDIIQIYPSCDFNIPYSTLLYSKENSHVSL